LEGLFGVDSSGNFGGDEFFDFLGGAVVGDGYAF